MDQFFNHSSLYNLSMTTTTLPTNVSFCQNSNQSNCITPGYPRVPGSYSVTYAASKYMTAFDIFKTAFLSCCLPVNIFGNICVIWISCHRIRKYKAARLHVLVLSLAMSDTLQGLFQVIPQLAETVYGEWACGVAVCKIHALTRSMLTNISSSTLAIIAMERCVNLEKIHRGSSTLIYVIGVVVIWCVQAALAVPLGVWNTVIRVRKTCSVPLSVLSESAEYNFTVRVVCYFVPLTIMWLCNIGVICKLRASSRRVQPITEHTTSDVSIRKRNRRVTWTCLMLAVVFTINLTPFQTALILIQTKDRSQIQSVLSVLRYLWLMTVLNSCINPFIYGIFLKEFRQRFLKMMSRFYCKKVQSSTASSSRPQNANKTDDSSTSYNINRRSKPGFLTLPAGDETRSKTRSPITQASDNTISFIHLDLGRSQPRPMGDVSKSNHLTSV